jgi:DNA (cytosine-5)-methyltransferase 1
MIYKIIENHPNDSRVRYKEDGVFQTLSSRMGTGGGQRANGALFE